MPEILTESFCERCGTRYTFESGAPRGPRLKGVKVLSRGLKNFVMSDDTSLDEAMAAARSESDREITTHQLDAFHKTFNFCMSCRQYTCANCWNEAESRCLSCAPHLGQDILQAPFPHLDPAAGLSPHGANGGPNGQHEPPLAADAMAWPTTDLLREDVSTPTVASGFEATTEAEATTGPAVVPADEAPAWDRLTARIDEFDAGEIAGTGFDGGEDLEPIDAAARLADIGAAPIAQPPAMRAPTSASDVAQDPDGRAAAAAEQTTDLLQRFRPGQSLDDEIAAFERERGSVEPEVEPIVAAAPEPELEPVAAASEPEPMLQPVIAVVPELVVAAEPEPVMAAAPEPEPVVAAAPEPEPVVAVAPEPEPVVAAAPEPEPVVAAEPEPEPVAAEEPRRDVVEQPTWRIVAPDAPAPTGDGEPTAVPPRGPFRAPPEPIAASTEPHWPAQPEWPAQRGAGGLPSFGRPAMATGGIEQLWAESAREVTAAPVATAARSGVQACVSCGLSLSATARFCRRCGTRQG